MKGSPASQLVQLIRCLAHNTDVTFELASVVAAPPELSIQIDNMSVPLEKDDLIVVESLTKYEKKIKLTSKGNAAIAETNQAGMGITSISGTNQNDQHPHMIISVEVSDADLTIDEGTIEYDHELKKDDRILVACINKGQTYIILDRLVTF